ncbi:MAG: hypothetical protein RLZZ58_1717 [Pseudomonadota bacterium]|jgi:hypothetical protein
MNAASWLFRLLVALIGVGSLRGAWQHWFDTAGLRAARGIGFDGAIGAANVRADIGGIFLAIGLFALLAAATRARIWLVAALVCVGSAITGRAISAGLDGLDARTTSPIITEAAVILTLALAWFVWRAQERAATASPLH